MSKRSSRRVTESPEEIPGIERELREVLKETDLASFEDRLAELQLTRLEHFQHVEDAELENLAGLSAPATRRLRAAIDKRRKRRLSSLFKNGLGGSFRVTEKPTSRKPLPESEAVQPSPSTCLITKDQLKLLEKIGEGSFAVVKRASWNRGGGKKMEVAVKIMREAEALGEEMETEVENMHRLQHPNLIRLYGLVFTTPLMMVVEYCAGGALLERLRTTSKPRLLVSQLSDYGVQMARGMCYLEHMRFIHRDLAARNVLLSEDERRVKIGDFGLMRALPDKDEHYVMQSHKKVPFAWCPPESLKRRQFSHASDVWSLGVTLWEMWSFGEEPWCGFRGPEILRRVEEGERLARPMAASASLYALMLKTWESEPGSRPRFPALKEALKQLRDEVAGGSAIAYVQPDPGTQRLRLDIGDPVLLIEALPEREDWLGQSVKSREVGYLPRSAFAYRDEKARHRQISKPIRASFIHAGHGDAAGGESWGQPDKIDPLILNNPMPLIDLGPTEPSPCLGAQVVESVKGLGAKRGEAAGPLRPPPPNPRRAQQSGGDSAEEEVDPFAPFDDYGSVCGTEAPSHYYAMPPSTSSTHYATGPSLSSSQPKQGSIPEDPELPSAWAEPISGPPVRNIPPPARLTSPADPVAKPPPTSSSSSTPSRNMSTASPFPAPASPVRSIPSVVPPSPSSPATASPVRPRPTPGTIAPPPLVSRPPSQSVPGLGRPLGAPTSSAWLARAVAPLPPASLLPPPDPSEPDPFEVPENARTLLSKPRYTDMYTGSQPRSSVPTVSSTPPPRSSAFPSAVTAPSMEPLQAQHTGPPDLVHHPIQASPVVFRTHTSQAGSVDRPRSAEMSNGPSSTGISLQAAALADPGATVDQLMARLNAMDAAMARISTGEDTASSNHRSSQGAGPPVSQAVSLFQAHNASSMLQPMRSEGRAASVPSVADPALLDQFDPLSSRAVPDDAINAVIDACPFTDPQRAGTLLKVPRLDQFDPLSSRAVPDDAINAVIDACPFNDSQRAVTLLKAPRSDHFDSLSSRAVPDGAINAVIDACPSTDLQHAGTLLVCAFPRRAMDIGGTTQELKMEKLVDMGLAPDRARARETLLKYRIVSTNCITVN